MPFAQASIFRSSRGVALGEDVVRAAGSFRMARSENPR